MSHSSHPIVGVIGGMGPEATVDLMRRVIAATPASDDADHIHMIVDNNPKIPSRIAALIDGTGESPSPEMCRMAKGLEASGASFIAIPCNTAHAYLDDVRDAVGVPVLDMPRLTANYLKGLFLAKQKVGVLASTSVLKIKHYDKVLAEVGLIPVYPQDQSGLMTVIRNVKRGDTGATNRARFKRIAQQLYGSGCDVLLIACTELSMLSDALGNSLPFTDAMDVLVNEIVRLATQDHDSRQTNPSPRAVAGMGRN